MVAGLFIHFYVFTNLVFILSVLLRATYLQYFLWVGMTFVYSTITVSRMLVNTPCSRYSLEYSRLADLAYYCAGSADTIFREPLLVLEPFSYLRHSSRIMKCEYYLFSLGNVKFCWHFLVFITICLHWYSDMVLGAKLDSAIVPTLVEIKEISGVSSIWGYVTNDKLFPFETTTTFFFALSLLFRPD